MAEEKIRTISGCNSAADGGRGCDQVLNRFAE